VVVATSLVSIEVNAFNPAEQGKSSRFDQLVDVLRARQLRYRGQSVSTAYEQAIGTPNSLSKRSQWTKAACLLPTGKRERSRFRKISLRQYSIHLAPFKRVGVQVVLQHPLSVLRQ